MDELIIEIPAGSDGERADVFFSSALGLSRSRVKKIMESGGVRINGRPVEPSKRLSRGAVAEVECPPPERLDAEPQDIPIDVIYQDSSIAVVNKPRGMAVHPGAGRPDGTLVNALLWRMPDLSGIGGRMRPGIVHRLDMNTSGIILVAKNDRAHERLSSMFENREICKEYLALVHGVPERGMHETDAPIGRHPANRIRMAVVNSGRQARSLWRVEESFGGESLVHVWPKTGRTHQIRVHLAYSGYPIVGDFLYGAPPNQWGVGVQMLHAWRISFRHPDTGEEMVFEAPLPDDMGMIVESLRG